MPEMGRFVLGRQGIESGFVEMSVATIRIYREISDAERREILEKMGPLAWIDPVVGPSTLHDKARGADVRPFYRNAQPRIAAAPAARTHENVATSLVEELSVELFDFVNHKLIVSRIKSIAFYVYNILYIRYYAVPKHTFA